MNTPLNRTILLLLIAFTARSGYSENNPEQSVAPPGVIFELLALNKDIETPARPKYRSPDALAPSRDGKYLYVAEQTAKRISVLDLTTQKFLKTILLPNEPTGIAVAPDGLLYVTCSSEQWPDGMVCEVNVDQGKVLRHLPGGHGARSPVLSHDGKTLYVCNQHSDDVYVVAVGSGALEAKIGAMREPYSADITPDDSILVVANCLPVQKATDTLKIASKILLFDTYAKKLRDTIPLPTGSHSVFGLTVSPDGKYAFATHLVAMFTLPATKVDGGWIHTNNCAIVDIKNKKIKNDFSFDEAMQGSGNPWGISCTPDGKMLCAAHSGSNEISIVDIDRLITIADTAPYSPDPVKNDGKVTLSHSLTALRDVMKKVSIKGKAPRALTIVGRRAYTAGYFDDFVEAFDLAIPGGENSTAKAGTIDLGAKIPMTSERRGENAFFDASLCYQHWQSCQSCHPLTRTDGLNWTLRNEFAAPKNAKSMLYSWWTPPTAWAGVRQNAYESIRAGMLNELFLEPDYEIAGCMDTFFMKLKPVPSPRLVKGKLSPAAIEGKKVFLTEPGLDCKKCHPVGLYTDMKKHNSGFEDHFDNNLDWDTPTMVECWRGAPYNHLGSMDQMTDIMKYKSHSNAGDITDDKFKNLLEFILSL
jgi:YVTN family beta-propeller protein